MRSDVLRGWSSWIACAFVILLVQSIANAAEPQVDAQRDAVAKANSDDASSSAGLQLDSGHSPVAISVARDRAKLLHHVYLATQDVMHRRYFHGGKAAVPARAMEDVFSDVNQAVGADANWISVSLEPMSINHAPKTSFEKHAARQLKSGKDVVELVQDGVYRRATPVSLSGGCIQCHAGLVSRPPSRPVAGLVISIAIVNETSNPTSTTETD